MSCSGLVNWIVVLSIAPLLDSLTVPCAKLMHEMVEMTWFGQRLFDHTHSLFSGIILWVFCYPEDTILPLFLFEVLKLVAILACLVLNCRVNFWKVLTTLVCIQVRVTGNIFYSFQKYFKLKCRKSFSHHTHCLGAVGSPWNKLSIRMAFCWEKKHHICCAVCLHAYIQAVESFWYG